MQEPNTTEAHVDIVPLMHLLSEGRWSVELPHSTDCDLIIWITRGQGRVLLDGNYRGFGPHTVLLIPAGSLYAVELGRHALGQVLRIPDGMECNVQLKPEQVRVGNLQDQAQMTAFFDAISQEQAKSATYSAAAMRSYTELVTIHLQRLIESSTAQQAADCASRRLSREFCNRLAKEGGCTCNITQLADELGVTPTHLSRVCKQEMGKSASSVLTERQLHVARSLLTQSDMPMREISDRLGFGSAAYFSRFITQHTQHTPSHIRRMARSPSCERAQMSA